MKTPEQIAAEIIERFSWSSNVIHEGRMVAQQYIVGLAIAEAIRFERDRCAAIPEQSGKALIAGRRRTNQVDRHTADVLMRTAQKIRGPVGQCVPTKEET